MTAGTKAILLLSVFGLVVLVACYGDGPSSNQADQTNSGRPADPLLVSASEISSPRERIPAQRAASMGPKPTSPVVNSPPVSSRRSSTSVPDRSVKVVRETSPITPTFTMGAARTAGIKVPTQAPTPDISRAGTGVGRSTTSKSAVSSRASEQKTKRSPVKTIKPSSIDAVTIHIIKPGDTLGHIAQKYYGSARKWPRIADANPDIDVDSLRVGQELRIPARIATVTTERSANSKLSSSPPTGRTHTIDEGETLSSIAEDHLGDQVHWYRIYELNKDRIGSSPDRLVVGMVIAVPE